MIALFAAFAASLLPFEGQERLLEELRSKKIGFDPISIAKMFLENLQNAVKSFITRLVFGSDTLPVEYVGRVKLFGYGFFVVILFTFLILRKKLQRKRE